jgi:DNA polymerase-3 subunit gamma/tau
MDYQALYRKYRPNQFSEVVGQRHVTETLLREVIDGKTAHAYLFAGPRGTGKTTTARLLAKALNCENPGADGEPDDECASCAAITAGTSLDVIELDAASHNKVEDIREIRINVGTVAVSGAPRRVYILDEAHMLSRAAGNALLKTLEEPPEHVVFVLATTDPYKLLDTIRSRSQRFDFLPVSAENLIAHLTDIAGREGITVDGAALGLIATHAGGSVRDAMGLLEQVAALGGGSVEPEEVSRALGLADPDAFGRLADAVHQRDVAAALRLTAELSARGADLRRFIGDALGYFRGIFLAQYSPNLEEVVDDSGDVIAEWRAKATVMSAPETLRVVDELGDALVELRQGREERLVVELAMIRLTRPETSEDVGALRDRIDRLESQVRGLLQRPPSPVVAPAPATEESDVAPDAPFVSSVSDATTAESSDSASPRPAPVPAAAPSAAEIPATAAEPASENAGSEPTQEAPAVDMADVIAAWPVIVAGIRDVAGPRRHALVKEASPAQVVGTTLRLAVPTHLPFHLEQMSADDELRSAMERLVAEQLTTPLSVVFVGADGHPEAVPDPPLGVSDDEIADLESAVDDDGDGPDPADLVIDLLGGEVVSD